MRIPDRVTIDSVSFRHEKDFQKGRERFFNKSELLLKLGGSIDVAKVYDVFTENGTAYYAMEYVEGSLPG